MDCTNTCQYMQQKKCLRQQLFCRRHVPESFSRFPPAFQPLLGLPNVRQIHFLNGCRRHTLCRAKVILMVHFHLIFSKKWVVNSFPELIAIVSCIFYIRIEHEKVA